MRSDRQSWPRRWPSVRVCGDTAVKAELINRLTEAELDIIEFRQPKVGPSGEYAHSYCGRWRRAECAHATDLVEAGQEHEDTRSASTSPLRPHSSLMSALVIPRHPDDALLDFSSPTIQLPLLIGSTPSTHADLSAEMHGNLSTEMHGDLSTETHGDANSEHGEQWDNSPSLYTAQILGCLTSNDHRNSVYVAALRISGGDGTNTEELVVCKVARGQDNFEELCREANFYIGELRGLQGKVIPWFYGLFDGDIDGVHVGVAVLSYCGKPLSSTGKPFEAYSLDLQYGRRHS